MVADLPGPSLEHALLRQSHPQGQVLQTVVGRLAHRQIAVAVDQQREAERGQRRNVAAGRDRSRNDGVFAGRTAPTPPEHDQRGGESAQSPDEPAGVTQPDGRGQQPQGVGDRWDREQVLGPERPWIRTRPSCQQRETGGAAVLLEMDPQFVNAGFQPDAPRCRCAPCEQEFPVNPDVGGIVRFDVENDEPTRRHIPVAVPVGAEELAGQPRVVLQEIERGVRTDIVDQRTALKVVHGPEQTV